MSTIRVGDDDGSTARGPAPEVLAQDRHRHGEVWVSTTALPPGSPVDGEGARALGLLLVERAQRAERAGAQRVHWETDEPGALVDAVATGAGYTEARDVLQLRRALPLEPALVDATTFVEVRPIRLGTPDEAAWVRTNNRAFADHRDQGHETVESLRRAAAEPWFDPAGFLVAEEQPGVDAGGDLDGFCWTKVHPAEGSEPVRGEIYVIGVDPAAAGRGLGRSLVVAGLDHLARAGIETAMLYVDATNAPARLLYDRLGFTTHHVRRVRSRPLSAKRPQTTE